MPTTQYHFNQPLDAVDITHCRSDFASFLSGLSASEKSSIRKICSVIQESSPNQEKLVLLANRLGELVRENPQQQWESLLGSIVNEGGIWKEHLLGVLPVFQTARVQEKLDLQAYKGLNPTCDAVLSVAEKFYDKDLKKKDWLAMYHKSCMDNERFPEWLARYQVPREGDIAHCIPKVGETLLTPEEMQLQAPKKHGQAR